MVAVWRNHIEAVQLLGELGANLDDVDDGGNTILQYAKHMGETDMINLLTSLGAELPDPNSTNASSFNLEPESDVEITQEIDADDLPTDDEGRIRDDVLNLNIDDDEISAHYRD